MTERLKPGRSGDITNNANLSARISIKDLIKTDSILELVHTFVLTVGGIAGVCAYGSLQHAADVIDYIGDTRAIPSELQSISEKIRISGEYRIERDPNGKLLVGYPIRLKCDGHEYLKGCFVASCEPRDENAAKGAEALAKCLSEAMSDRISLNYGSRVARDEYDALHKELGLGNRLISLLEDLGTGMMVVDRNMRVVWANSVMGKRKTAYKVGCYCYDAIPTDKPCHPCATKTAFETGQPQIGIPGRRPDGTIYTRTSTMPIPASDGTISHVLTLITDYNETGQADSELINYKRLVDTSDDFMMISDAMGRPLAVNRKIVDVLGYPEHELIGKHPVAIVSMADVAKFHEAAQVSAKLGIAMDTVRLHTRDGVDIPTQMVIAYDRDRNVYGIVFSDLSERLRMEAELRSRTEELQAQNQKVVAVSNERDRFFRSVSHELRTPLTSIIGFAELLLEDTDEPLSERQKHLMTRVVGNSHKLLAMVSDLLDLSKIEAGRMEVHLGMVKLDEFIAQIVGNLSPLTAGKNLALKIKENTELPPVHTDEQKLSQIIVNLVSNAIKFTNEGSVEISAKAGAKSFSISVKDTGMGIAEDELEDIFTEFYQARGPKPSQRGSGLGLAISQRMAALLGGKIAVKSRPGVGSTFTVTLPITGTAESRESA